MDRFTYQGKSGNMDHVTTTNHADKGSYTMIKNNQGRKLMFLKDVKKGEYIRREEGSQKTYTRGAFIRDEGLNKFQCDDQDDISRAIYLKGSTLVWVNFTY